MAFERQFAEILKEKMTHSQGKAHQEASISEKYSYIEHHQPFISAPLFTWSPSLSADIYPKNQPIVSKDRTPPLIKDQPKKSNLQEPTYKIGELGLEIATPFMTLIKLGAHLDEKAISLSQLKKEFRALAKKYHPDYCHHPEAGKLFQSCCQSYRQIKTAIMALSRK